MHTPRLSTRHCSTYGLLSLLISRALLLIRASRKCAKRRDCSTNLRTCANFSVIRKFGKQNSKLCSQSLPWAPTPISKTGSNFPQTNCLSRFSMLSCKLDSARERAMLRETERVQFPSWLKARVRAQRYGSTARRGSGRVAR